MDISVRNQLKRIRLQEGLKLIELAERADLSTRSVARVERGFAVAIVTKYKILRALNGLPGRERAYSFSDIFPNDAEE